jgi:hypothetical protein
VYGGSPLNMGLDMGAMEPSARMGTGIRLISYACEAEWPGILA